MHHLDKASEDNERNYYKIKDQAWRMILWLFKLQV